jgi:5-deoxy-glucuronate isomerase
VSRWHRSAGSAARDGFDLALDPADAGWEHSGLYVVTLAPGESKSIATGGFEWVVLPLSGSAQVRCGGEVFDLTGRADVFAGPTDFAYVPIDSTFEVSSERGARLAFPSAKASRSLPFRYVAAEAVSVEMRGAGQCSRQVNNFATPGVLDADSLIACEVLTPAGNWSSYPPHKHDQERPGLESELEEIYYFELRTERGSVALAADANPVGYQRVYGTDERPIDVLAEVRDRDVVLVPHGWHGPAMAAPGYDMYYLNVMAGPGNERAWRICDDPAHGWVRETWAGQEIDPRLPFEGAR